MQDQWSKSFKSGLRRKERREVVTSENTGTPFLTVAETAERLGIAVDTLYSWVENHVIPKPRKWKPGVVRRPFRREFVERLRDFLVIRASTTEYRTIAAFRKLSWAALLGLR